LEQVGRLSNLEVRILTSEHHKFFSYYNLNIKFNFKHVMSIRSIRSNINYNRIELIIQNVQLAMLRFCEMETAHAGIAFS